MAHVLVVDDDPGILQVTCEVLNSAGYEVTAAAGVREGLDAMGRRTPDVVLTDFAMPDGTGHDILEGARELPACPPVIVMSGSVRGDVTQELLSAGACRLLDKPFALPDLLDAVQAATEQSQAGRSLPSGTERTWM